MTYVDITSVNNLANSTLAALTTGAINQANGNRLTNAFDDKLDKSILVLTNSGTTGDITVKAGVGPRSSLGDYVVSLPGSSAVRYLQLESARFKQADGSLYLEYASGVAGTVAVVKPY
jgi:hypothetical protein